ncbi:lipoprotein signal peptidase [Neisseria dumasiana]|nr:lipoprotein signal peptidase [Neisseria dumasiana]UOO85111.1 lipoprotein signal peptidase [Neisseria dumasiana]
MRSRLRRISALCATHLLSLSYDRPALVVLLRIELHRYSGFCKGFRPFIER